MSAALIARLVAAGTPADLIGDIAMALGRAEADQAAIAARREADRARKEKQRHVTSQEVTTSHVTSRDKDARVHEGAPAHPEITKLTTTDKHKTPPSEGQKAKAQPARRSRIASDAQPTGADRKSADEAGMTPATFRTEWGLFRDHHVAEATSMADWQAAWRTWIGKWVKWGCKQHGVLNGNHARAGPQRTGNSTFGAMDRLMNGTPSDEPGYHPRSDWNGPEILATAKRLS